MRPVFWFKPLPQDPRLKKNCRLRTADADIERIVGTFLAFDETEQSRIFDNAEFGYSKVTVERPLRATGIDPARAYAPKEIKALKEEGRIAEDGAAVVRRIHKPGKVAADPLRGLFPVTIDGKRCVVEYEPDSDRRDTETVPLKEAGGIEAFIRREVLPHAPDAWIDMEGLDTPSATRSASPATSTSRSPCARLRRSAPTFWRWNAKPMA